MSEARYTPGPWCLDSYSGGWYVNQKGGPGYIATLALIPHQAEECEANANLIAAAPELLAELERQINHSYNPFEPDNQSEGYKRMVALRAKAAGGAT